MRRLAAVLLLIAAPQALAIVNGVEPSDERLDAVGALGLAAGLHGGHDWHCSATLVAPRVAVIARHCLNAYGMEAAYALRFRRALDGTLGSIEAGPSSFYNVAVSGIYVPAHGDAALVSLSEAVRHVAPIPLRLEAQPASGPVVLAGWGREGPAFNQGRRRRLMACSTETGPGQWGPWRGLLFWPSAWDGGPCGPNTADSGGAVLSEIDGELGLVAVVIGTFSGTKLSQYANDPWFSATRPRRDGGHQPR